MNQQTSFSFTYTLTRQVVRNLKIEVDKLQLEVTGTGYFYPNVSVIDMFNRYGADVDFVIYDGKDVKPLLEFLGELEAIEEAAVKYVARVFTDKLAA